MSFSSRSRRTACLRIAAAALIASASVLLAGCSGSLIADHLPNAVGGLPEEAPARPAADTAYPAVHNMPPSRGSTPLSYDQQKQLEDELVAARNRYGGSPDTPATTGSTNGSTAAGTTTTANPKAGGARNP
ncbi:MAG TPA: hypothetical protein VIY51_16440 [Xanthobacteraceae bacterium]